MGLADFVAQQIQFFYKKLQAFIAIGLKVKNFILPIKVVLALDSF